MSVNGSQSETPDVEKVQPDYENEDESTQDPTLPDDEPSAPTSPET